MTEELKKKRERLENILHESPRFQSAVCISASTLAWLYHELSGAWAREEKLVELMKSMKQEMRYACDQDKLDKLPSVEFITSKWEIDFEQALAAYDAQRDGR